MLEILVQGGFLAFPTKTRVGRAGSQFAMTGRCRCSVVLLKRDGRRLISACVNGRGC
jgi:hypothetical protein